MRTTYMPAQSLLGAALLASVLVLSGCNQPAGSGSGGAASGASGAVTASQAPGTSMAASDAAPAYTPPSAEQLYALVAPIALFPDKLVAQVLAGATYPDQVAAANTWLTQNPALKSAALQAAANGQAWDVSIKSLTMFPSVLNQMATNLQWTTALGGAYLNDPADVMNAIQVMRQRASQHGTLKSSSQLRVASVPYAQAVPPSYSASADQPVYDGPIIVQPPPQTIIIEPAQPDTIYVPAYDPAIVYGERVPVDNYAYHPAPGYRTGSEVATGVISFGVGVAVGAAIANHYNWGWHAWNVNWGGGPGREHGRDGHRENSQGQGRQGGRDRPAVVYNNSTYISKSTTVINHISNRYDTTNNIVNRGRDTGREPGNRDRPMPLTATPSRTSAPEAGRPSGQSARPGLNQPATVPHFTAADTRQGARPSPHAPSIAPGQDPRQAQAAQSGPQAARGRNAPGQRYAPGQQQRDASPPHAANTGHGGTATLPATVSPAPGRAAPNGSEGHTTRAGQHSAERAAPPAAQTQHPSAPAHRPIESQPRPQQQSHQPQRAGAGPQAQASHEAQREPARGQPPRQQEHPQEHQQAPQQQSHPQEHAGGGQHGGEGGHEAHRDR